MEGASFEQLTVLYSNLYRMYLFPNNYSENTGTAQNPVWKYSSLNSGSLTAPDIKEGKIYVGNGLWDTFRAPWPAYSLLTPTKAGELLNGLLEHYKNTGWIGRWINPGASDRMLGSHADVIFADAAQKGIDFDAQTAFDAVIITAPDNPGENIYIQSVKRDGKAYTKNYLTHEDLVKGGAIEFQMGPAPSDWGTDPADAPASITPPEKLPI